MNLPLLFEMGSLLGVKYGIEDLFTASLGRKTRMMSVMPVLAIEKRRGSSSGGMRKVVVGAGVSEGSEYCLYLRMLKLLIMLLNISKPYLEVQWCRSRLET